MKRLIAFVISFVLLTNLCGCCFCVPDTLLEKFPGAEDEYADYDYDDYDPIAPEEKEDTPAVPVMDEQEVIDALNGLLSGVNSQNGKVSNWTDEDVYDYIYSKLLDGSYGTDSYLDKLGLGDSYSSFDLEMVEKLTQDSLGRDLPAIDDLPYAYISGEEFVIEPAAGAATEFLVQSFTQQGDEVVAVGIIVFYGGFNTFCGYFEAQAQVNPSSIYGYTLVSVEEISGNQDLSDLTATASSVLENSSSYNAENAIDGNEKTAWVEGAEGDGIGEWILLSTADGSQMELYAIDFMLGYHKSENLLQQNGAPTSILLEFEDGTQQTAENLFDVDVVVLEKPVKTSWVKITILDARRGTVYTDTCISDIELFGLASE